MERDSVIKKKVWRKAMRPGSTQFISVLMVAAVGVFDYFSGFPNGRRAVNVLLQCVQKR
jgi:hypothetical protein